MKKLLYIIFSLPFLFLLLRCEKEKEQLETKEQKFEIYYSYEDTSKQLISDNDSITVDLGDTLLVFVEISDIDTSFINLISSGFETEKMRDLEYSCVAKKTGLGTIAAYSSDLSSDLLTNFFVVIPSVSYTLIIVENSFIIDVENESLETTIHNELEDAYEPDTVSIFNLSCTTIEGGDLQFITNQKDTITGTFTSSNIINMNDILMDFNNYSFNFEVEKYESSRYYRYLKQDLTEEFRTKYPTETINEITVTSLALFSEDY